MKRVSMNWASAREAGFSLVELLVALVLLSMVAGLLASGLSLGQRVWRRSEERAQASRAMFDAQTALRRLLDDMQPLRLSSQDARTIEFRGSTDQIEGIVPLPNIGLGGLYRLRLFWKRGKGAIEASILPSAHMKGERRPAETSPTPLRSRATSTAWSFAISAGPREKRHRIGAMNGRVRRNFRHSFPSRSQVRKMSPGQSF